MTKRIYNFLFIFILGLGLLFPKSCIGGTLDNWNDPKAYKPRPVLFLPGFNSGPATWQTAIARLSSLFSKYQPVGAYLETIDFQDITGSIDTYSDGKDGWADRLKKEINTLLANNKYGFYANKLNLICYSMGGLAAREFLTNPKYPTGTTDKVILIGAPNLGAPITNTYNDIITVYKIGSITNLPTTIIFFDLRNDVDSFAEIFWLPSIEVSEGMKDMLPESSFLNTLNNRSQPTDVQYYGIYGIIGNFLNMLYFHNYYGGDGVVSKDSQLGVEHVAFVKEPRKITAFHTDEPAISVAGNNPLLKLLDSTPPEFTLDTPQAGSTTEINTNSISIKGKVYKEYLPADSEIIINGFRQEDGAAFNQIHFPLKPSSLWIPNNPDSPVAEFDETIAFPGKGTYKIFCRIKNPANLISNTEVFWVKVILPQPNANIIVHCHNPEGKEIASIQGVGQHSVEIYDGATLIGYGAYDATTHGKPISIPSGNHTIKAKFNGMVLEQTLSLNPGSTTVVTFTYPRTEMPISSNWVPGSTISGSGSMSHLWVQGQSGERFFEVVYGSGQSFCYGGLHSNGGAGWVSGSGSVEFSTSGNRVTGTATASFSVEGVKGIDWEGNIFSSVYGQFIGDYVTTIPPTQGFNNWYAYDKTSGIQSPTAPSTSTERVFYSISTGAGPTQPTSTYTEFRDAKDIFSPDTTLINVPYDLLGTGV